ncbi:MAG: hypothetical protein ACRETW_02595 [Stenotrophobium sp.]
MANHSGWLTLRELDASGGHGKGHFFRIFKRMTGELEESRDYVVLDYRSDAESIKALRSGGRIYGASINVILVSPALAQKLRDADSPRPAGSR